MTLVGAILVYIGTHAQRLALATTGLPNGSTWEETDTGVIYKWDGTAWFTGPGAGDTVTANQGVAGTASWKVDGSAVVQPVSQGASGEDPWEIQADDGDIATLGLKSDAAVTDATTTNTLMAFVKGLVKILADVWDSTNHRLLAYVSGAVASGAADSGNPVKIGGKYNATLPTFTDGQRGDAQLDSRGNLLQSLSTLLAGEDLTNNVIATIFKPSVTATYSPSTDADAGSVTKKSVKASAGAVVALYVTNKNAAIRFFQLHNKASAPAAGETAQLSILVPAGSATQPAVVVLDVPWFAAQEYFGTGVAWAWSTTETTFTDSATAADHSTRLRYV